jgi:hypothetical protein
MSTRSAIIIENEDGTAEGIYCHSDGYPGWNGKILLEHYQDEAKVRALIALGDISSLAAEIGEKHGFDYTERPKGQTTAYHRDRGEAWHSVQPKQGALAEVAARIIGMNAEYVYVYSVAERAWRYTDVDYDAKKPCRFVDLATAVKNDKS